MPLVDLSHVIEAGMTTYPGLPGPRITDFMTREESRANYEDDVEFHIGRIDLVGNTGTYLDTPFHRWATGSDLVDLPLERVAAVPGVVIRSPGPGLGTDLIAGHALTAMAVLFNTGWDRHWGKDEYGAAEHPFVTEALARSLAEHTPALVGIDSVNIDDTRGGNRPAHSTLLAAGIPVVEHLTGLDAVPESGFQFSAVPVKVRGLGTFPVRAFASW